MRQKSGLLGISLSPPGRLFMLSYICFWITQILVFPQTPLPQLFFLCSRGGGGDLSDYAYTLLHPPLPSALLSPSHTMVSSVGVILFAPSVGHLRYVQCISSEVQTSTSLLSWPTAQIGWFHVVRSPLVDLPLRSDESEERSEHSVSSHHATSSPRFLFIQVRVVLPPWTSSSVAEIYPELSEKSVSVS